MNISDISNIILNEIKKLYLYPLQILLFGSYGRNEQRYDSDIDFIIILKNNNKIYPFTKLYNKSDFDNDMNILAKNIHLKLNKKIDMVIMIYNNNYNKINDFCDIIFYENIMSDLIPLLNHKTHFKDLINLSIKIGLYKI